MEDDRSWRTQGLEGLLGEAGAGATGRVAADGAGRIALAAARSQPCLPPFSGIVGSKAGGRGGSIGGGFGPNGGGGFGDGLSGLEALSHAPTA